MPANTPNRGYEYPLYDDPAMDFPTAIQALAEDVDADMTILEGSIAGARDRPSVAMSNSANGVLFANTLTTLSWSGATVEYDNAGMALTTLSGGVVLSEQGVYSLSACVIINATGSGGTHTVDLQFASTGGVSAMPTRTSVRGIQDTQAWVFISTLHYHTGVGTDTVSVRVWQNSSISKTYQFRQLTATKVSNVAGGF